jgi:hypothetical protein
LFGSQTQEQNFHCRGGLAWWRGFVFAGCTDFVSHEDDIRGFSSEFSLDERHAVFRRKMTRPVTLLSVYGDYMLSYAFSRKVHVFQLSESGGKPQMDPVWTLDILDHVSSPICIVSLSLVCLNIDRADASASLCQRPSAVLINAYGRLLVLPLESHHNRAGTSPARGPPPSLIATNVEMSWSPSAWHVNALQRQLSQAIWLACGADGMKVWLSLPPQENDELHVAKRVMLPLGVSANALNVLFYDLVLVGAYSDASPVKTRTGCVLPFFSLQRQAQLYMHHILRQVRPVLQRSRAAPAPKPR